MDDTENKEPDCNCSFCGKDQGEVAKLIAGPDVFICDECIDLCNEIVKDEEAAVVSDDENEMKGALKPMAIKDHLDDYVIGQDFAKKVLYAFFPSSLPRCSACRFKKGVIRLFYRHHAIC